MNLIDISFPHPVLGDADAIGSNIALIPKPIVESTTNSYKICVNYYHNNDDLNNLLQQSKIEYVCEATCSNTLFRKIYRSEQNIIEFEILKKQVKGRVEFVCLMVAKQDIKDYLNSEFHPDYSDYRFDIEEGDIMAKFGIFHFDADIKYNKLKAVSSLMEIVENSDLDYSNIDLRKSKIEIQLPSEDYLLFNLPSLSKEAKFASIFHSSIVLYALNIALYNIEDNSNCLWARAIRYRLENEDQFKNISLSEKENIPEIAQRLLGNPINRLMNGLKIIIESSNENDN